MSEEIPVGSSQETEPGLDNMVINFYKSRVLGFLMAAKDMGRTLTKEEIVSLDHKNMKEKGVEMGIQALIKDGLIEQDGDRYKCASEYPGKGLVEHLEKTGALDMTKEIAKELIAEADEKQNKE